MLIYGDNLALKKINYSNQILVPKNTLNIWAEHNLHTAVPVADLIKNIATFLQILLLLPLALIMVVPKRNVQ